MESPKKARTEERTEEEIKRNIETIYNELRESPQNDLLNTHILRDIMLFLQTGNSVVFDYDSERSAQLREYYNDLIDKKEIYKNNPVYQAIIRGYKTGTLCTGYYKVFNAGGKKSRRQKSRKSRRFRRSRKARR